MRRVRRERDYDDGGMKLSEIRNPTLDEIMSAKEKPRNCSDARWRMELSRRNSPFCSGGYGGGLAEPQATVRLNWR